MNNASTNLFKKGWILVVAVFLSGQVMAQKSSSGINIGIKAGSSKMITEITSDFSQHLTEFDHDPGLALDLEFSKFLGNHFEVGTSINLNILQGDTTSANFTSINNATNQLRDISVGDTVKYHNRLLGQRFFVSYYFRDFSNIEHAYQLEPFLRTGLGYIKYAVEVKSPGEEEAIFGKGSDSFEQNKDISLFTAIYFLTAGVKTYLSPNFYINASYTINYVPYDFLDGVYNYNYSDGSRADMKGLFSEFKIGIFFQTGGKRMHPGGRRNHSRPYLPFHR